MCVCAQANCFKLTENTFIYTRTHRKKEKYMHAPFDEVDMLSPEKVND